MKRYIGLWRDTWWAWLIIFLFGIIAGSALSWIFFSALPIGIFTFFYFGLMRYDNDGNAKEM
ncbi:MAG: hypothetical protein AAF939_15570 [Planctomycetota bacterium]